MYFLFSENVEEKCNAVQDCVFELENLCDEADIKRNKNHHKQQLQLYTERKSLELEQGKGIDIGSEQILLLLYLPYSVRKMQLDVGNEPTL